MSLLPRLLRVPGGRDSDSQVQSKPVRSTATAYTVKLSLSVLPAALAALLNSASVASAHLSYSGRDFGTLIEGGPASVLSNQTVSSAFGWADGTDADQGDSHRGRFYRFTLTATTTVVITAERNALGSGAAGTFLPAISLFAGLGQLSPEQSGHDGAALSVSSRPGGAEGSIRAFADWSIGNDPTYNTPGDPLSGVLYAPRLASFTYLGNAADGSPANYGSAAGIFGDGAADGFVTGTFPDLPAGDYSIFVGGANYAAQSIETGPTFPTYGVTVSVQAIAIPEPAVCAFGAGAAVFTLGLIRRRHA